MNLLLKSMLFPLLVVLSSSVHAITINDTSDDFTVNWSKAIDATHTLKAQASFNVISFTNTKTIFDITLSNLTNPGSFQAAIMSIGLYTDNELKSATLTNNSSAATWNIDTSSENFPGGYHDIDVCIFAANNCQGGNINQGLQNGQTDSFTLSLSYLSRNSLVINNTDNFPIKFQTGNSSFEFEGTITSGCTASGCTPPGNGRNVPEPAAFWMIGIGILGLAAFSRKQSEHRNLI